MFKVYKKSFLILMVGFFVAMTIFLFPQKTDSQFSGNSFNLSYGGKITNVDYQKCCNGYIIEVEESQGSPQGTGGKYLLEWWSIAFALKHNFNPVQNAPILGKATRGGICVTWSSECESTEQVDWVFYPWLGDQFGVASPSV